MEQIYTLLKRCIIGFFILLLCTNTNYAYNYLQLENPHSPQWRTDGGNIENPSFIIKPKGLYMECELHLTFSARETIFNNNDTLEVSFNFMLPKGSMITNAHLLIEDSLMKARLMERWAATRIYENIVNRVRRDPLIVYKNYGNNYFLRIYPMKATESRKAIITFLVPANWTKNYASIELPTEILNTSKKKPEEILITVLPGDDWKNPRILEIPNAQFKNYIDPEYGECQKIKIKHEGDNFTSLSVGFDTPMKNGLYLNTFDTGSEGYYQMAFLPSQVLNMQNPKKVAVIIDYDSDLTYVSLTELLFKLEKNLKEYLSENDHFNLIYHDGNSLQLASNDWITADEENISETFNAIKLNVIADTNKIIEILPEAVKFILDHNEDGSILIMSSSNNIKDKKEAETIISLLQAFMDPLPQINTINLMEKYWYWWDIMGEYYYGNEYLYSQLAKLTGGEYYRIDWNNTISSLLTKMFQSLDGFITTFDMHTSMDDGFCYSRFNIPDENTVYLNKPFLQVGKYIGSFPFEIEISALTSDGIFMEEFSFNKSDVNINDTSLRQVWAGNYIDHLENSSYNYKTTREIIDNSLEYYVLSQYTAFLALEPGMSYEVPEDDQIIGNNARLTWGGGEFFAMDAVSNSIAFDKGNTYGDEKGKWYVDDEYTPDHPETMKTSTISVNNSPNPFINHTIINLDFGKKTDLSQVTIEITDLNGQVVRTFDPANFGEGNQLEITWKGDTNRGSIVHNGTYLFIVITPNSSSTTKLLKIR